MARLSYILVHLDAGIKRCLIMMCAKISSCDEPDRSSSKAKAEIIGMSFMPRRASS